MTSEHESDTDTEASRRRLLQLSGGALAAALAGCLGGGDSGGGATTADGDMTTTEGEMTTGGGMTTTEGEMTDGEMTGNESDDGGMEGSMSASFRIRIENVSTGSTLQTMDGSVAVPLSPGAWVVHGEPGVLFRAGEAASDGLEGVAEDGSPGTLASELSGTDMSMSSGVFNTPAGASSPGPIGPGDAYEFEVSASSGARLSFATMFIQSNDLFYAPGPEGIALFADGGPVSGSVTDQLALWDAGTEANEAPGEGPNQAPRQSGPDTGQEEMASVRRISEVDDGFDYPAVADVIEVTVSPMG
jgi:hypothetical protein